MPTGDRVGAVPAWMLPRDIRALAALEFAQDRVASLTGEIEREEDGRKKGRLRRSLAQAEQVAAIAKLQMEQQSDLELELWAMLWRSPQAALWESSVAFERTLAQFVRWNVKAEQGDLDAAREARIRGKDFGLSPSSLMSLKAEIERADEAKDRGERRRRQSTSPAPQQGSGEATDEHKPGEDPRDGLYAVN